MERKLESQADYLREIAKIIAKLPVERAAEIYDFARFLLIPPPPVSLPDTDDDDWLNDSPEQIAQEEAIWEATFGRDRGSLEKMAAAAIAEYKAGESTPMFDEKGELNLP